MIARLLLHTAGGLFMLLAFAAPSDASEKGRTLAESLCARCHMNEGQGEKQGPMGVPSFRAIANRPKQSFAGIVAWLRSAPPMMPNHHLTQDEMHELANFILTLRRRSENERRLPRQRSCRHPSGCSVISAAVLSWHR